MTRRDTAAEMAETKRVNEQVLSRIGFAASKMEHELRRLEQILMEQERDNDRG